MHVSQSYPDHETFPIMKHTFIMHFLLADQNDTIDV